MGNAVVSLGDSLSLGLTTAVDSGVLSSRSVMTGQLERLSISCINIVHTFHTVDEIHSEEKTLC